MAKISKIIFDKQTLEFIRNDSVQKTIMGSPGSGKSSACCFSLKRIAEMQDPDEDGIRHSRFLIIRRTNQNLYETTAKSVADWFGDKFGMTGSIIGKEPPYGKYRYKHTDGTLVSIELLFKSMNTDKAVDDLKSLEVTTAWVNECNEIEREYLVEIFQRTHRYPARREWKDKNNKTHYIEARGTRLISDFNPQHIHHWTTTYYDSDIDNGVTFFKQPPAVLKHESGKAKGEDADDYYVNPNAPNIKNISGSYYQDTLKLLLAIGDYDTLENKYMLKYIDLCDSDAVVFGKQFKPSMHIAELPNPRQYTPVLAGFDTSGNHPCIVLGQEIDRQFHIQNGYFATGVGREDFTMTVIAPMCEQIYKNCKITAYCDPHDGRDAHLATSSTEWYGSHGIAAYKATTNDLMTRIEAVRNCLNHRLEDGRPYIVINKELKYLIEGLSSHYVYAAIKGYGTIKPILTNRVDKNKTRPYSDWIDALQYLCLELNARIFQGKKPRHDLKRFVSKRRGFLL